MIIKRSILVLFILSAVIPGLALAGDTTDKIETNIPFDPGGYLYLKNRNGDISISSWNEDKVLITAYKTVHFSRDHEADKVLREIEIEIQQKDDELEIITRGPEQDSGFFGKLLNGDRISYTVDYELRVPERIDLNLQTANGNIDIRAIEGRLKLETTNGSIEAEGVDGPVKCQTTNGSIRIDFNDVPDEDKMSFVTINGSIRLLLPDYFGGQIDAKTINGNIESDFPIKVDRSWFQKHFHGQVNQGNCSLYCSTVNGNIDLLYNH